MLRIILPLFISIYTIELCAQYTDDFERYNYSQRLSSQSLNWITWSENPTAGTGYIVDEDGIVSNTDFPNNGESVHFAKSGKQAMFIGKANLGSVPQDVVLNLQNKSTGIWNLSWQMYIPRRRNKAYYNFQEFTPINGVGNWAIQVYFNGRGRGEIRDDRGGSMVNFNYPWREWFELQHTIDLDNDTIKITLISNSGSTEIYNSSFLSNNQYLGGVDFYAIDRRNKFYIDDVIFEKNNLDNNVFIWDNNQWEDILGNPSPVSPDSSYNAILRDQFTVNSGTTLNALNLIIEENGSLNVLNGANVAISGNLKTSSSNNNIKVEDGGSFIMLNNDANIDLFDNNNFEYIRNSAVLTNAYDYTYWSSPVTGINISNLGISTVYTFNTANYLDLYSGNGYPQTTGSPDDFDDNGDDWQLASATDNVIEGKGYAALSDGVESMQTISFKGIPNNGYVSVPVFLSGNNSNTDDDWNLIGNPYPSAIDASVLINSNINMSGTLYFWTHNTNLGDGGNIGPADKNYDANDYASFNLSGGVAAGSGGEIPNGYIAAGQGFFMEVNDNGTITFNNDMRVLNTADENTQFYKSAKNKSKIINNEVAINENKIWLNFTNEKGAFSQSLIAFTPNATNGYEPNYDGIRAGTELNSKFFSVLGERELAIQGRSELIQSDQITLGFYIAKPDAFVISIKKMEGLIKNNNIDIYLKDHVLHKVHDLKLSDYHFNVSEAGKNTTRFTLEFENIASKENDIELAKNLSVVNQENRFKIDTNEKVSKIILYDIFGRLLIQETPNSKSFYLENSSIRKGTLIIVQVQLETGIVLNKKIIRY